MLKGAVPGSEGGYLYISDAIRRPTPEAAPMPAGLKTAPQSEAAAEPAPEEAAAPAADANPENGEA